jgi:hypothetical protein
MSIAGLLGISAIVDTSPPLFCNGPRTGSTAIAPVIDPGEEIMLLPLTDIGAVAIFGAPFRSVSGCTETISVVKLAPSVLPLKIELRNTILATEDQPPEAD